ncbi:MAG TPA: hypothetical protein PLO78_04770 [Candidatus Omnitrophota bacterium]|nr:hypothetical protein [Candidatus Omnitrophota bacterium]
MGSSEKYESYLKALSATVSTIQAMNRFYWKKIIFRTFLGVILNVVFILIDHNSAFPAEDVSGLIAQGETFLAQGDFKQTWAVAKKILTEDPQNLTGYRLALIYFINIGNETGFYKMIREAKKHGVSDLAIDEIALQLLFLADQQQQAYYRLYEYEMKWRETYDPAY